MRVQPGEHHGPVRFQRLERFHVLVQHDAQVQRTVIVKFIRGQRLPELFQGIVRQNMGDFRHRLPYPRLRGRADDVHLHVAPDGFQRTNQGNGHQGFIQRLGNSHQNAVRLQFHVFQKAVRFFILRSKAVDGLPAVVHPEHVQNGLADQRFQAPVHFNGVPRQGTVRVGKIHHVPHVRYPVSGRIRAHCHGHHVRTRPFPQQGGQRRRSGHLAEEGDIHPLPDELVAQHAQRRPLLEQLHGRLDAALLGKHPRATLRAAPVHVFFHQRVVKLAVHGPVTLHFREEDAYSCQRLPVAGMGYGAYLPAPFHRRSGKFFMPRDGDAFFQLLIRQGGRLRGAQEIGYRPFEIFPAQFLQFPAAQGRIQHNAQVSFHNFPALRQQVPRHAARHAPQAVKRFHAHELQQPFHDQESFHSQLMGKCRAGRRG